MASLAQKKVVNLAVRFCSSSSSSCQRMQHRSFWANSVPNTSLHTRTSHARPRGHSQTCVTTNRSESIRFYSEGSVFNVKEEPVQVQSSEAADLILHQATPSTTTQEMLDFTQELQGCGSPSDVLDLSGENLPAAFHVSRSLMYMWNTTKKMSDHLKQHELLLMFEHPKLENLLQRAVVCVATMRPIHVSFSLLRMIKLGVPQNSCVVQTFLRTCQERLKEFDEKSLSILAICLTEMESSSNVTVLKECMRLLIDDRLPEITEVKHLQNMMLMLGKDTSQTLKYKIKKKALSMTTGMYPHEALRMISVLAKAGLDSKPLLDACSEKIIENLAGTPFLSLIALLQACEELHRCPTELLTGVSDYVASNVERWTSKELCLFLTAFEKLRFCPASLMEALTEKMINDPENWSFITFLCFLRVYSSLSYDVEHRREQFLEKLNQGLDSYLPQMSGWSLLQSVLCLCVLGHFPAAPLEKLLQPSTIEELTASGLKERHRQVFQMVDLCLRLDRPGLPRPLTVPPSVLGDPMPDALPVKQWLSESLRSVVVEHPESRLQEMVVEENFIVIDGVITTAQSEASSPAGGTQRVAVTCQSHKAFHLGTHKPCGTLAMKMRHLRILGYRPVVLEPKLKFLPIENRSEILSKQIFPEQQQ